MSVLNDEMKAYLSLLYASRYFSRTLEYFPGDFHQNFNYLVFCHGIFDACRYWDLVSPTTATRLRSMEEMMWQKNVNNSLTCKFYAPDSSDFI